MGLESVAETEVVAELELVVLDEVEAVASVCCCICISVPRSIFDRLALDGPVRPPSAAAVVSEELEVELVDEVVEEELEDEVDSSRDSNFASIWEEVPVLDNPEIDMVGSPVFHSPAATLRLGKLPRALLVPTLDSKNGGRRRHANVPLTSPRQRLQFLPGRAKPSRSGFACSLRRKPCIYSLPVTFSVPICCSMPLLPFT